MVEEIDANGLNITKKELETWKIKVRIVYNKFITYKIKLIQLSLIDLQNFTVKRIIRKTLN